jgi:two-component system nitrate/nitrite response regulator NarL
MNEPIRILLVDDHRLVRSGIHALLAESPGLQVVGEAADAGEALRLAAQLRPDVVLLDIHLPGVSGIDTVQALRDAAPRAAVLMLTVSDDAGDLAAALRAGAHGYLLKTCDAAELVGAVQRAHRGELVIGSEMAPKVAAAFVARSQPADPIGALTRRERQIGEALARGASNKLIARELDIAETTVKVHVQSILRKLGLGSRVQIAVAFAERRPRDGVPPADDTA